MKQLSIILCFFVIPYTSYSQVYHSLEINSDNGFYNSNISANTLLNSLGYIDDTQKQNILNSLDDENSFYFDVNNSITFYHKKGFSISLGNHITSYGYLSDDLIKLALYGNTTSSGESYDLLPLETDMFHYSDITFGFNVNDKLKSSVSLIAGHQFLSGNMSKFDFSMAENGEYITYDLSLDGVEASNYTNLLNSRLNDETSFLKEFYRTNGRGLSFGFDYAGEIYDGNYKLSLKELGFIIWNDKTNHHDIDASSKITPIEVSDFSEIEFSNLSAKLDSLRDLNNPDQDSYYFSLPARFNGSFNKLISNKFLDSYTFSIEHRFKIYDTPRLALDFHKVFKKHELALGYHTGGMEQRGFQFKYHYTAKDVQFQLFTRQANLINQAEMYGFHLGIGLKYLFGRELDNSSQYDIED